MSWICESVPVSGKISLGVVDQSALRKGSSASEALADSVRLAAAHWRSSVGWPKYPCCARPRVKPRGPRWDPALPWL